MELGRLEKVDIRSVWPNEEKDFTPWVEKNIELIANKIDVELEDVSRETRVGSFSADLVCKIVGTEKEAIIENQFGESDHDHLGKLLTYSSGREAKVAIWIAEKFRDEHVKALEYLNENSIDNGLSFFAIEITVKKIGDSKPAPELTIIIKPNKWAKDISSRPLSEKDIVRGKLRLEFFSKIAEEYKKLNPSWNKVKAQANHWLSFGSGKRGLNFGWVFRSTNGYRFALELYIDVNDEEENLSILNQLKNKKVEIESELGLAVDFQELPDSRACRVEASIPTGVPFTKLSDKQKGELINWGTKEMKKFSAIMQKHIQVIDY
jgi:hypothetical protein